MPAVEERVGIERAFDVIKNYDVHTKGYVMTALKLIEEFGTDHDKAALEDLLKEASSKIKMPAATNGKADSPSAAKTTTPKVTGGSPTALASKKKAPVKSKSAPRK